MLVITLRTVTFIVAWRWCSRRTISSAVVPCAASSSSSQRSAGRDGRVLVAQALEQLDARGRRQRVERDRSRAARPRRRWRAVCRGRAGCRRARRRAGGPPGCARSASARRRRFSTSRIRRLMAIAHSSPIVSGSHLLVGADHPPQALRLEPAVRVRDVRPGEAEDPRIAREVAVGQLRKLAVVVGRQVVADLAELLVDDVEVVDEPFGRRRDRAFVLDGPREGPVRLEQDPAVLGDARTDRAPATGESVTVWAAARLWACCSSRSTLKSSARIGSSLPAGVRSRGFRRPPEPAVAESSSSSTFSKQDRRGSGPFARSEAQIIPTAHRRALSRAGSADMRTARPMDGPSWVACAPVWRARGVAVRRRAPVPRAGPWGSLRSRTSPARRR